jgi:predicted ester cyclase
MSPEQNKVIVYQFITEALSGRNVGLADEVLAPNYVNLMTGADLSTLKAMLIGLSNALSDVQFEIADLVAQGDSVVAQWKMEATHTGSLMGEPPTGKRVSSRCLTFYRLIDGKIAQDDPVSAPDLLQSLGIQMPT